MPTKRGSDSQDKGRHTEQPSQGEGERSGQGQPAEGGQGERSGQGQPGDSQPGDGQGEGDGESEHRYPQAQVEVIVSHDQLKRGEVGTVDLTSKVQALIDKGYLRLVGITDPDRPGQGAQPLRPVDVGRPPGQPGWETGQPPGQVDRSPGQPAGASPSER